jgi:hypothetical protein
LPNSNWSGAEKILLLMLTQLEKIHQLQLSEENTK